MRPMIYLLMVLMIPAAAAFYGHAQGEKGGWLPSRGREKALLFANDEVIPVLRTTPHLPIPLTDKQDFEPSCVRLGDEQSSYVNIEFSPTGRHMSWGNAFTPLQGYEKWSVDYWIAAVDPVSGRLISRDGKDFLVTADVEWGTFAYWGLDVRGAAVYTIDKSGQIFRVLVDEDAIRKEQLTGPVTPRPQYIYASRIPEHPSTYLVYLKEAGPTLTGSTSFEIFWRDTAQPDVEYQLFIDGKPYRYPQSFYSNPRWVPGQPIFVFPRLDHNGYIQVAAHDVVLNGSWLLTTDPSNKVDPFPFLAPEYPEEWLLMAVVNLDRIGVYRSDPRTTTFRRLKTIDLPSVYSYEQSAESFVWNGRTYLSAGVNRGKPGTRLKVGTPKSSQLWIADIDPSSTFARKVNSRNVRHALDPESLATATGVYVYGYARKPDSVFHGLYQCQTGLGN